MSLRLWVLHLARRLSRFQTLQTPSRATKHAQFRCRRQRSGLSWQATFAESVFLARRWAACHSQSAHSVAGTTVVCSIAAQTA